MPTSNISALSAVSFVSPISNNKALNVTYVPRPTGNMADEIKKALDNTNKLRAEKGLKPLVLDENLSAYAQMRATEIETLFDHKRPSGEGIGNLGENLAAGSASADSTVLTQWRNSSGHYNNIIHAQYDKIGIGFVYVPNSTYKYYWVQIFDGAAYNGKNNTVPYAFVDGTQGSTKPLEQLVIGNTTIALTPTKAGEWQRLTANNHQGWVAGYQHSRFGIVTPTGQSAQLFYQGLRTTDSQMPKSDTATYNGVGLMVKNGQISTDLTARFTADFGKRTLNGSLTQNGTTLYALSADINGGAFASKTGANVETQGVFFGNNADELSGVFKDTKSDTKGVFGAKK